MHTLKLTLAFSSDGGNFLFASFNCWTASFFFLPRSWWNTASARNSRSINECTNGRNASARLIWIIWSFVRCTLAHWLFYILYLRSSAFRLYFSSKAFACEYGFCSAVCIRFPAPLFAFAELAFRLCTLFWIILYGCQTQSMHHSHHVDWYQWWWMYC